MNREPETDEKCECRLPDKIGRTVKNRWMIRCMKSIIAQRAIEFKLIKKNAPAPSGTNLIRKYELLRQFDSIYR
ncbi:MAG: hypothetical protein C4522_21440 [Desulfobacteraceae bacterium]|nr:MAG: hypothetical protein C4522_21440 [Desulfobacteraceae bacterium]